MDLFYTTRTSSLPPRAFKCSGLYGLRRAKSQKKESFLTKNRSKAQYCNPNLLDEYRNSSYHIHSQCQPWLGAKNSWRKNPQESNPRWCFSSSCHVFVNMKKPGLFSVVARFHQRKYLDFRVINLKKKHFFSEKVALIYSLSCKNIIAWSSKLSRKTHRIS